MYIFINMHSGIYANLKIQPQKQGKNFDMYIFINMYSNMYANLKYSNKNKQSHRNSGVYGDILLLIMIMIYFVAFISYAIAYCRFSLPNKV